MFHLLHQVFSFFCLHTGASSFGIMAVAILVFRSQKWPHLNESTKCKCALKQNKDLKETRKTVFFYVETRALPSVLFSFYIILTLNNWLNQVDGSTSLIQRLKDFCQSHHILTRRLGKCSIVFPLPVAQSSAIALQNKTDSNPWSPISQDNTATNSPTFPLCVTYLSPLPCCELHTQDRSSRTRNGASFISGATLRWPLLYLNLQG